MEPPVRRRWGCVIPVALFGLAATIGGLSIVYDWLVLGGRIQILFLLACLVVGPLALAFAAKVYRDPSF